MYGEVHLDNLEKTSFRKRENLKYQKTADLILLSRCMITAWSVTNSTRHNDSCCDLLIKSYVKIKFHQTFKIYEFSTFCRIFKTNNIGVTADIFYAPNLPTKAAAFNTVIETEEK